MRCKKSCQQLKMRSTGGHSLNPDHLPQMSPFHYCTSRVNYQRLVNLREELTTSCSRILLEFSCAMD